MGAEISDQLFQKVIRMAKTLMSTVPMIDDRDAYDMHDLRWVLKDPIFTIQMLATVGNMCRDTKSDSQVEEILRIFLANKFSRQSCHVTIREAKERINILSEE